ncbi:hypothetical protein GUJ93_ZPchr0010g9950 [Zizania palustris]|uniref:Uncharacterized protein n=1 Tax=Zizania palustris TaxID=103762 RepID=A0A8J5W7U5_ZIZPA|nr:hypothetical protein GUJ93_ZPchr0010g9950 [Zizania palustris]
MVGGGGEAAKSPPSGGGKRGRDPEEDVYVDNLHSHKRYLCEVGLYPAPPSPWMLLCMCRRFGDLVAFLGRNWGREWLSCSDSERFLG